MNPSFLILSEARVNVFSASLPDDRTHDMEWILENV